MKRISAVVEVPKWFKVPEGYEVVCSIRKKKHQSLQDLWLPDAPFPFELFSEELKRYSVINKDGQWIKYAVRGGHSTASFYVVGCYECLLYYGCVTEMSWPGVMRAFNSTFKTEINTSKVLENKTHAHKETNYFLSMFAAFANPTGTP